MARGIRLFFLPPFDSFSRRREPVRVRQEERKKGVLVKKGIANKSIEDGRRRRETQSIRTKWLCGHRDYFHHLEKEEEEEEKQIEWEETRRNVREKKRRNDV